MPGDVPAAEHWEVLAGLLATLAFLAAAVVAMRKAGWIGRAGVPADRVKAMIAEAFEQYPTPRELQDLELRLARAEGQMESLPSALEFASVNTQLATVGGEVKAVQASVDGMQEMLSGMASQVGAIQRRLMGSAER